jgi:hypothetical protein
MLGVTGHREFRPGDEESLRTLVTSVIGDIRLRCAHTPLILLTPLADGADRLVAKIALDAGAWLIVPLPFPRPEYEATFRDDDSRRRFGELLAHPRTIRTLHLDLPQCVGSEPLDAKKRRDFAYFCCGAFVARHSQILIALWDGRPPDGVGGTGAIVEYRRTGRLTTDPTLRRLLEELPEPFTIPHRPLDAPEFGPVYQIVTPKPGVHQSVPGDALTVKRLALAMYDGHPERAAKYFAQMERQWEEVDAYNERWPAPSEAPDTPLSALAAAGTGASTLARTNQRETYRALNVIFALVLVAALAFEGYAHLIDPHSVASLLALTLYVALIAVAYLRYREGRLFQTAFQDTRALAEGLRVQLAWRRAGLPRSVADHYLRKHTDELTWIRDGVDAWGVITPPAATPDLDAAEAWITGQEQFYAKAAERDAAQLDTHRQGGVGWVAAGVLASTTYVVLQSLIHLYHARPGSTESWEYLVAFATIAAAAVIFVGAGLRRLFNPPPETMGEEPTRAQLNRMMTGVAWGVATVLALAVLPAALDWLRDARHVPMPNWLTLDETHGWIVVGLGLVTLAGAFHHTYAEQRAFAEHQNQYERMAKLFERGRVAFHEARAANDRTSAEQVLVALGAEALAEHADWLVLHRERPLQIPKVEL